VDDVTKRVPRSATGADALDAEAKAAVGRSPFGSLPRASVERLSVDINDVVLPPGCVVHPEGSPPFFDLVARGVIRVVASSPDGRHATIRYARAGDVLGAASLFTAQTHVVAAVVLQEARVLMFRPGVVRRLALTDPSVAEALFSELAQRIFQFHAELVGSSFATLRQKVARHLLDIASPDVETGVLVARISQSELADAVGTSREVVVRVLRDLRESGLVGTGRDGLTVLAPGRLHAESLSTTP
jgi:CRP/FNR family cyclic AMP-dependent transcriptional regulator